MPRQTDDRTAKADGVQDGRPAVTNRAWGMSRDSGDQSFGYEGQGGYGDFREERPGTTAGGAGPRDSG